MTKVLSHVMFVLHTIKCEIKTERNIKCDKSTVICNVGTTQCKDGTIKCEKK